MRRPNSLLPSSRNLFGGKKKSVSYSISLPHGATALVGKTQVGGGKRRKPGLDSEIPPSSFSCLHYSSFFSCPSHALCRAQVRAYTPHSYSSTPGLTEHFLFFLSTYLHTQPGKISDGVSYGIDMPPLRVQFPRNDLPRITAHVSRAGKKDRRPPNCHREEKKKRGRRLQQKKLLHQEEDRKGRGGRHNPGHQEEKKESSHDGRKAHMQYLKRGRGEGEEERRRRKQRRVRVLG